VIGRVRSGRLSIGGGIRFFGEKLSADFGLVAPLFSADEFIVFPMINIVRKS
jgi:hypothetical protein